MVNHRALTAAMIDSRDFLAACRRAETELLVPAGPKIAFTGGMDFNDPLTRQIQLKKLLQNSRNRSSFFLTEQWMLQMLLL
jgi:hypothetical protein